ncbi:hypothetical protein CEXT_429771 [Caerostris extrusa]|uniref:Uncharacterized protein n=1 Tax=Caerostris extrusa TaxID=172846 RepID=A0AAV4PX13_CAEEX|nr:hypothetical protein CEXT_429771 [Caerostris extrusa]
MLPNINDHTLKKLHNPVHFLTKIDKRDLNLTPHHTSKRKQSHSKRRRRKKKNSPDSNPFENLRRALEMSKTLLDDFKNGGVLNEQKRNSPNSTKIEDLSWTEGRSEGSYPNARPPPGIWEKVVCFFTMRVACVDTCSTHSLFRKKGHKNFYFTSSQLESHTMSRCKQACLILEVQTVPSKANSLPHLPCMRTFEAVIFKADPPLVSYVAFCT